MNTPGYCIESDFQSRIVNHSGIIKCLHLKCPLANSAVDLFHLPLQDIVAITFSTTLNFLNKIVYVTIHKVKMNHN